MAEWENEQEIAWMYGIWDLSHTLYVTLETLAQYEIDGPTSRNISMDYHTLFRGLAFMAAAIEYNIRSLENDGPIGDGVYDFESIERVKEQFLNRKRMEKEAPDQAKEAESES